jgi:hypothetical protein
VCEHTFVPGYGYMLTEHDPSKPWLVLGREHRTVTLDDGANFFEWAHREWPAPRWSVEIDPGQLSRVNGQVDPRPSR